jgi:predicted dehydrogenase
MSERLQALVIGCGKIGGMLNKSSSDPIVMTHALAYFRHEKYSLAACVDPNEEARQRFMARWGVSNGFASIDDALSSGIRLDVASVAAPTTEHEAILQRLLNSPIRAVLAEKPLGGNHAAAARLVDAFERGKKPLLVFYIRRFDPAMDSLRQEIADGIWGELRAVSVFYGRGIMNNGSHAADLISYLTAQTDYKIISVGRKIEDGIPGDPSVEAVVSLGGANIHFLPCDGSRFALFEITLVFSKGLVSLEENGFVCRRRPVESGDSLLGAPLIGSGKSSRTRLDIAFLNALDAMFNAIHANGAVPTAKTALPAIRICESIRESAVK